MNTFKNEKNFRRFLKENVKIKDFDYNEYLKELVEQHETSGNCSYELPAAESKSGHPCIFSYAVNDAFFLDGKEASAENIENNDFDYCDVEFIF